VPESKKTSAHCSPTVTTRGDLPYGQCPMSLEMSDSPDPFSKEEICQLGLQHPNIHLNQGELLFTPMEEGKEELFVMKEGRIRLYKVIPQGRELTIEIVRVGMVFGEITLTVQRARGTYAEAMEPSVTTPISWAELKHLVLDRPEVGLRIIRLLSERSRFYQSRIEDLASKDVQSRLAILILHLVENEGVVSGKGYRIPTRYTHHFLSTMIGTNREAVTRAFAQLQDEEVVQLYRRHIYVTDLEALKRIANQAWIDQKLNSMRTSHRPSPRGLHITKAEKAQ
jgi:CRP/FNR family transcriptional regulator, cyclic AMP receptor protein